MTDYLMLFGLTVAVGALFGFGFNAGEFVWTELLRAAWRRMYDRRER